jgi:hypothetical protein
MVTDWPSCLPISAIVLMGADKELFAAETPRKAKFPLVCLGGRVKLGP